MIVGVAQQLAFSQAILCKLNALQAFQPWRLTKEDIELLTRDFSDTESTWSVGELMHVVFIIATFHSLSAFVLGCGIIPEVGSPVLFLLLICILSSSQLDFGGRQALLLTEDEEQVSLQRSMWNLLQLGPPPD